MPVQEAALQSFAVPLQHPPVVVDVGHAVHGLSDREERFLLPELYSLHIYDWAGELKIGDRLHRIRPGDLALVPPGTLEAYRYNGPSQHVFAHVRLPAAGPRREIPSVQSLGPDAPRLRARLVAASTAVDPGHRAAEVWSVLWAAATRPSATDASTERQHPAVLAAVDHIDRHLHATLRVDEVARVALASTSHLNRLFVGAFGISVSRYVRRKRADRARHLLRDTLQPISSVAATVGIPDLQAFNKFCRSQLGAPPRALRSGER
ncbi:AraC family transcriptional regulator [Isoptericola hypogeus]|uniref:AraC family transcriptional regulator n=1 Tax=Isoptericola hypogeus TaxID=300179 RepID=A0ABN2J4U4_9MICO